MRNRFIQPCHIRALVAAVAFVVACPATLHAQGLLGRIGQGPLSGFTWSDVVIFHDYRIQKSVIVGHYKLVDPDGRRVTFGDYEVCKDKLYEIRRDKQLPELPAHVVIVIHGLGATRQYMQGLADHITREGNLATVNFGYPSTMGLIEEHAESLASVIRNLEGVKTIDFVAHSMGNIVVRKYLYDLEQLDPVERPPVKFRRMVMIAPPNHGAGMATNWADSKLAQMAAGKPLDQLAPDRGWPELEKHLATPNFEFGIIAGGRADGEGYLGSIPGDDDALLSIDTMKLAGANDFVQTKGLHQLMAKYKQVRAFTLAYLQNGFFISAQARQAIVAR